MPRTPHVLLDARFAARMRGGDRCCFELARQVLVQSPAKVSILGYAHAPVALNLGTETAFVLAPFIPSQHPQADIFEHFTLARRADRLGIDVYHATFNVLPLRPMRQITVLTVHDMAVFDFPDGYGRKFAAMMRFLIKSGIRRANKVIAVSEATKRAILHHCPEAKTKITVILNGVDERFLRIGQEPQAAVRGQFEHLSLPTPYVLFVGNLEPKKNLPRLIQAFMKARREHGLPHKLVIVGEKMSNGPDARLPTLSREETDVVQFLGFVDDADLPALYRLADLVAYPSLYEGFGMPVLEGMAAGVPVLTSSVSSLPEVGGPSAMQVDPLDAEAMAAGIVRALTDDTWRRYAGPAGHARAAQMTWSRNARATIDLYLDAFANSSSNDR